jgi:hypothetical protein
MQVEGQLAKRACGGPVILSASCDHGGGRCEPVYGDDSGGRRRGVGGQPWQADRDAIAARNSLADFADSAGGLPFRLLAALGVELPEFHEYPAAARTVHRNAGTAYALALSTDGIGPHPRSVVSAISTDGGRTWDRQRILASYPSGGSSVWVKHRATTEQLSPGAGHRLPRRPHGRLPACSRDVLRIVVLSRSLELVLGEPDLLGRSLLPDWTRNHNLPINSSKPSGVSAAARCSRYAGDLAAAV